jgi:hypothetical protein
LGPFGAIVDQDVSNLILQQRGMASTAEVGLNFGRRQEILIRHFNRTLDDKLA